jgi:hypothetical protein
MEEKNKYFDRNKMEEMLPDYLFGRLPSDEVKIFEDSLPLFPDIQRELSDARAVFERVDKLDFGSVIENRSRNISYKVNQKLGKDKYGNKVFGFSPRLIAPVIGLIAIVVVLVITADKNPFQSQSVSLKDNKTQLKILTPKDAILIIGTDSSLTSEELTELTTDQISAFRHEVETVMDDGSNSGISDILHDIWLESFESLINNNTYNIDKLSGIGSDGADLLEYLDENDFQELIKEIQNEKFPS